MMLGRGRPDPQDSDSGEGETGPRDSDAGGGGPPGSDAGGGGDRTPGTVMLGSPHCTINPDHLFPWPGCRV